MGSRKLDIKCIRPYEIMIFFKFCGKIGVIFYILHGDFDSTRIVDFFSPVSLVKKNPKSTFLMRMSVQKIARYCFVILLKIIYCVIKYLN